MSNHERHPKQGDKIARYKWTVSGKPGDLRFIPKGLLQVDHLYQRDDQKSRTLTLAANWSWVSCAAIVVAERSDGTFWVLDGQHRLLAAQNRSDIKEMPCVVFSDMDLTDEARAFFNINKGRRPLTSVETFRALVLAEDRSAMVVNDLAQIAGRQIRGDSNAKTIRCVSLITKHVNENEPRLRKLWPLIIEVCQGRIFSERVVDSFMFIEARMPVGESLTDRRWHARIMDVGYDELAASMNKFASAYARGGARVWSLGVVEAINKGLRNRLVVNGLEKAGS